MMKIIFLELNEVNFEFLEHYIKKGKLPNFGKLFKDHGYVETTSENKYEDLEPWIQWVTAHTGQALSEHGVFRLGDIVQHDFEQIWEQLEKVGLKVGAVSPMNAKNRTDQACFFIPDPWTRTAVTGNYIDKKLCDAISQVVNDNAQSKVKLGSFLWLLLGGALIAKPSNFTKYLKLILGSKRKCWNKALFLDLLLSDLFTKKLKSTSPDFSTLFLNAGAHIQHHYMFSSSAYSGELKNPSWYVSEGSDPLLDVYELYDGILGGVRKTFPDARMMLATGLHQTPHPEITYYWRLKNHTAFLERLGVPFERVEPRMSRDFLVVCSDDKSAADTEDKLLSIFSGGEKLFEVDNRGSDLFVTLSYPNEITSSFEYSYQNTTYKGFDRDVAFVAIKNGQHNGVGYFCDTGAEKPLQSEVAGMSLGALPSRIKSAFSLDEA